LGYKTGKKKRREKTRKKTAIVTRCGQQHFNKADLIRDSQGESALFSCVPQVIKSPHYFQQQIMQAMEAQLVRHFVLFINIWVLKMCINQKEDEDEERIEFDVY